MSNIEGNTGQFSRREFLEFAGTGTAAIAALKACQLIYKFGEGALGNRTTVDFGKCYPSSKSLVEHNTDPVFRASTVRLEVGFTGGIGFLLRHTNGGLSVTTVLHVAEHSRRDCLYATIPGTGVTGTLDWRRGVEWGRDMFTGDDDIVSFVMTPSHRSRVQNAINTGAIIPLQMSKNNVRRGDRVGIPNAETGKVGYLNVESTWGDIITMKADIGEYCQGRSGSPVLRWDPARQTLTNELVGVTNSIYTTHKPDGVKSCSDDLVNAMNVHR